MDGVLDAMTQMVAGVLQCKKKLYTSLKDSNLNDFILSINTFLEKVIKKIKSLTSAKA